MRIKVKLKPNLKDNLSTDKRTDFYVWKDLVHLKKYYSDVVDEETIDTIANDILSGKRNFSKRDFLEKKDIGEHLNERGLCNLVEMELLSFGKQEIMEKFLNKPVYSNPADIK